MITSVLLSQVVCAKPCETKRQIFIDNPTTKVWKTTICPNQKLAFHTHQYARVIIPDEDGQLNVIYKTGKKAVIILKKQTPVFLNIAQGKLPHQDENTGKNSLHVTVVELKAN